MKLSIPLALLTLSGLVHAQSPQGVLVFANGWVQAEAFDILWLNGYPQLVAWTSSGSRISAWFNPPSAGYARGLQLAGSYLFAMDPGCGGALGYYTQAPLYTCSALTVPPTGYAYTTNLWSLGQCVSAHQMDNWVWKYYAADGLQSHFAVNYKSSPCTGRSMPIFCAVTFDVTAF